MNVGAHKSQKRGSDPLELELEAKVSCLKRVLRTFWSSEKKNSACS